MMFLYMFIAICLHIILFLSLYVFHSIGTKLSEDSRKYGAENTCTSGGTLCRAALSYSRARAQMEKERGNLLKALGTQVNWVCVCVCVCLCLVMYEFVMPDYDVQIWLAEVCVFYSHNLTVLPVLPNMTGIYSKFGFLFGKLGLSKSMVSIFSGGLDYLFTGVWLPSQPNNCDWNHAPCWIGCRTLKGNGGWCSIRGCSASCSTLW